MRLGDGKAEHHFRLGLRAWLSEHVPAAAPGAPTVWSVPELRAWSAALYAAGYAGLTWAVEHGGRGLTPAYQAIYAEESALAGAPDHVNVIGLHMVGPTIIRYGSATQRERILPRILSGDAVYCQGFSEPDAGSDLAAVRTRASRHPGGYQLDGEKVWSSYAHLADHCLLLARSDPAAPKHKGLTCFLIDMAAPGIEVRPIRQISGDSSFNQIILNGVSTGIDTVLGPVGEGWRVAMSTLAHERGTFGITLTARLARDLDRLVRTAIELGVDQDRGVRDSIADLHVRLQGLRFTGYRALAALERTGEPGPESSIMKLRWSQANQRLTAVALGLLGDAAADDGPAAFWGGYWQRQRLRARTNSIEGGTTEILRGLVAERVLGLPRSR